MKQRLAILFLLLILLSVSGTGCQWLIRTPAPIMPQVLPPAPTVEQVTATVNQNSRSIYSFKAEKAKISVSGAPQLDTNIAMMRPHNFRLQAGTLLTGPELDLGSNDQYFWFWVKRDSNKAVYYCEHDQFETSPLRQQMPISPDQLLQAFGLVEFEEDLPHQMSINQKTGNIELRTAYQTPAGPMTRVVVVHPSSGWILAQALYNSQNQPVMYAHIKKHRRDPLTGWVMPQEVVIKLPQNQMEMTVNLGNVAINGLTNPNPELWTIPEIQGAKLVNIGGPRVEPSLSQPSPLQPSSQPVLSYPDSYGEAPYTVPSVPNLDEVGAF